MLLEWLAKGAYGNFADEPRKHFVDDLTATLQVIALDAKIQGDFDPDVVAYYRLIGYESRDVCQRLF